jgi:outer membrane lipoprotein-sorting protein
MKRPRLTLFLTVAAAVGIILFLIVSLSLNRPDTPEVTLPSPAASDSGTGQGDGDAPRTAEVNPATVRAVLAKLSRVDSYSRRITVETFWNGGSSQTALSVWVRGDSERVIVGEGPRSQNILLTDGEVTIWYDNPDHAYTGPAAKDDADRWQRVIDYESLLSEDLTITDAAYDKYNGEPCITVAYLTPELSYVCRLHVSVSSGLLLGSETYDGDTLVLRMTGSDLDITTPEDGVFTLS